MQRLRGRVVLVTGASRGAGKGIALVLGEEGATLWDAHWAAPLGDNPSSRG